MQREASDVREVHVESMNLPNTITMSRIAATPLIATLAMNTGWQPRLSAWLLYVVAAVTDYYDGKLARQRNLVTDLGRLLDPLADKLLLVATLVPMYWLTRDVSLLASLPQAGGWLGGHAAGPVIAGNGGEHVAYPFITPLGLVGLPAWILLIVLGRELVMTLFRQYAAKRGVVISAIGPAKLKTTFQSIWVGAAFFWFFASAAAVEHRWTGAAWKAFAMFNGVVGTLAMVGAVALTIYSLVLYFRRYGGLLKPSRARAT